MFLLYFLDTFINWLNIYKEFHWIYSLTGAICIKRQEKLIQKNQISDHTRIVQNQPSAGIWNSILVYWRLSGYERIIRVDQQNCLFDKREIFYDKPSTCEKRWVPFL